ncbi:hypothetical protein PLICRDRAFT_175684 [Plicaturopsis crispa FD-325 SS-3]|nr:hypothetical protein PLICRDRAFT_175684 [Plicaturopsis crispa FD-325 SS-3]
MALQMKSAAQANTLGIASTSTTSAPTCSNSSIDDDRRRTRTSICPAIFNAPPSRAASAGAETDSSQPVLPRTAVDYATAQGWVGESNTAHRLSRIPWPARFARTVRSSASSPLTTAPLAPVQRPALFAQRRALPRDVRPRDVATRPWKDWWQVRTPTTTITARARRLHATIDRRRTALAPKSIAAPPPRSSAFDLSNDSA